MADRRLRSSWLGIWTRAVIVPAARKAAPVWIGSVMVGTTIFGPTGMEPRDLTQIALEVPLVGAVLAVTWLLLFLPTAQILVRQDAAMYLRSLPAGRVWPVVLAMGSLVALQLPWLVLWVKGERVLGAALVGALTLVIVALAAIRPRRRRLRTTHWRGDHAALRGIYLRALTRRAGDAIVRGTGLAILAGLTAGLFARNNQLDASGSAVLATGVIAVMLVPGWAGLLLPLVEAHRSTSWLASTLGVTERGRVAVLATTIVLVYALTSLVAALAACFVLQGSVATTAAVAGLALALAPALALVATRALMWAEKQPTHTPARVVTGVVATSALAIIALGWLGALGAAALAVVGIFAVGTG